MNIGIIGYGSFGKFLAGILIQYGRVAVSSKRDVSAELPSGVVQGEIEQVTKADIIILACPLSELEKYCQQIALFVNTETVVIDVTSVKVKPVEIMRRHLEGKCNLIATHPLFGPETVDGKSVAGKKIVVCPIKADNFEQMVSVLRDILGLEVIEMTPEEHDQEMAWVHALTFFVGRGLLRMNPPKSKLSTGYYQKLLDLVELESKHSDELFNTVEKGNSFAPEIRQNFIGQLKKIEEDLRT